MRTVPNQKMLTHHIMPGCFIGVFDGREDGEQKLSTYIGISTNHDEHVDYEFYDNPEQTDNYSQFPPHEGQWFSIVEAEHLHEELGRIIEQAKVFKMEKLPPRNKSDNG